MVTGCVYIATNRVNGKVYVGQTRLGVERRKARHFRAARCGAPQRFYQAIRKHGEDAFDFRELVVGPHGEWLDRMEIGLIAAYGSFGHGYNACGGGTGVRGAGAWRIRSQTPEARARISASQKAHWATHMPPFLGRKHTPETLAKMRAAKKGKTLSEEHIRKLSESHKGKLHAGHFHKHSDAAKRRMSEARRGIPKTGVGLENIRRGCAKRVGVKLSDEVRANMSKGALSKPMVTCPHCTKVGRIGGGMSRYHFDNCRKRGS